MSTQRLCEINCQSLTRSSELASVLMNDEALSRILGISIVNRDSKYTSLNKSFSLPTYLPKKGENP